MARGRWGVVIDTPLVDAVTWTPIVAPALQGACLVNNIQGSDDLKLRTTSTDADTEILIPAGASLSLTVSEALFQTDGTAAFYLQTASGIGPVTVVWG